MKKLETTSVTASGGITTGDHRPSIIERLHDEAQRVMTEAWRRSDIHPLGMSANLANEAADTIQGLRAALERIALLDEADGHELTAEHALLAVAIATSALGKHPSEICAAALAKATP